MSPETDPEPDAVRVATSPEGITTITLSRPHRRNAINPPTARKLYAALVAFDRDPAQKVAILHGAGGTFCAGGDLHDLADSSSSGATKHLRPVPRSSISTDSGVDSLGIGPIGPSRLQLSKPLICAVAGHAVAGGLELSLLADLRVVEEDAVFGVFCRRFGVPLIDGGTVRLPAIVGLGRALDLILTGREVRAQEALGMGLANRVVVRGKALEEAQRIARMLVRFPERCMRADRAACYFAVFEAAGLREALANEFEKGVGVVQAEGVGGAERFVEGVGRHGRFEGRGRGGSKL